MFPDPETFNPLRWLHPSFPTYAEPLSKYPTITGYSQFGYGRRVCQGQGVTEADLFVGIGGVAWLFYLSKDLSEFSKPDTQAPTKSAPAMCAPDGLSEPSVFVTPVQEAVSETNTEFNAQSPATCEKQDFPAVDDKSDAACNDSKDFANLPTLNRFLPLLSQEAAKPAVPLTNDPATDPTLQYTKLLIAKPEPFSFDLTIRSRARAEHVKTEFLAKQKNGEFRDAKVYWEEGGELGWGKV